MTKNKYAQILRIIEKIESMEESDRERFLKWLDMDIRMKDPKNKKLIEEYKKTLS